MARTTSTNYASPSFPKATTSTDPFLKEDIQQLAEALDTHDHTAGKGLAVSGGGGGLPPPNSVTSAMIVDGTIQTIDIADGQITSQKIASGAAAANVGALGGALAGTLPNPTLAANSVGSAQIMDGSIAAGDMASGAAASNVGTLGGVLTGSLPNPGLAPGSVGSTQILDGSIAAADMAAGAAATNVGTLGGALSGTLPNPSIANGAVTSAMIANGTIVAADIAPGTITSNEIADGTIATADLANAAVTNAKLASDTARLSLLTNGGFEIWQRGTAFGTTGAPTADRWTMQIVGTDAMSTSRDTANVDTGSQYCAYVSFTLGSGAGVSRLEQTLKVSDGAQCRGRTYSLSVRVKASIANGVRVGLGSDGTGATTAYSSYHTGGGVYQTLSATYAVPTDATYLNVAIFFAAGSTASYYLDNAMLVVGSQAADYAPLHPADDLARCLRYYEVVGASSNSFLHAGWAGAAGEAIGSNLRWRAIKAVTPTLTLSGSWSVVNCGQPAAAGASVDGSQLYATATAIGHVQFISGGTIALSAEANP